MIMEIYALEQNFNYITTGKKCVPSATENVIAYFFKGINDVQYVVINLDWTLLISSGTEIP